MLLKVCLVNCVGLEPHILHGKRSISIYLKITGRHVTKRDMINV